MLGSTLRRLVVVVAAVVAVLGAGLATGPAAHADPEPSACTANIAFAYGPGITALPAPTAVTGTMVLTCPLLADDAGMWTLPFAGPAPLETCEAGQGAMAWGVGATSPEGPVGPGGGFTYVHGYAGLTAVNGTIPVGPELHTFVATLVWLPNLIPANCATIAVTGATATGLAAIPLD
ncbi:MAG TPA: hypothetical protein VGO92_02630 [Acidimicrobiales bacterium]|jgi:hypothetical protein|nr:hypothetical protein [Acidimicrobiales bacterium]